MRHCEKSVKKVARVLAVWLLSTGASAQTCTVFSIADGDTISVRCSTGGQVTIRISGIDAPEKRMPYGQRSKQALSTLCYLQQAGIRPKSEDRYGRVVADVQCQGRDVGAEQVRTGMAWVYDRYARGHGELYPLQAAAKAAKLGLWADPDPTPPWEWRHAK
ncbi:MAG: thermonuclease family protein [Burkholderiales bacterium]